MKSESGRKWLVAMGVCVVAMIVSVALAELWRSAWPLLGGLAVVTTAWGEWVEQARRAQELKDKVAREARRRLAEEAFDPAVADEVERLRQRGKR